MVHVRNAIWLRHEPCRALPTVYCTTISKTKFWKYNCLESEHSRPSRSRTEIGLKSVIMHRYWKFFHKRLPDICAHNFATGSC